ncbi:MAG: AAA family ATPase, partial [Myxococcales bacterium]|nr:AAA family ATPase [Myxococcales bacterium]
MSNTAGVSGCVGRETELRRLGELYAAGRSQLAILSGPRGAGKSALLRALGARTRLEGGVVLEGRCAPGRPFAPFAEIVEGALRFLDQVGVAPRGRLEDLACEAGCHRLWFEHNQCSHASGAPEPDDGRSGERARERRFRFFEAIRWLLQDVAAIRKPVILLHHLEQADRESVRLLEHLLEACAELSGESNHPMLLAASVHSDGAREHASLEALMARAEELPLSRLDAAGVRAFLQSPRAVAKVLARTGGLPEAIEMLLEADPLTPEALLERRLAELPASASRLLKALAVLQGQADADQLARAAGVVLDARARAAFTSSELLSRTLSKGRMLFSFSRSSLLEHAYANLEPRERTELHGRWAEIFASEAGEIERAAHHAIAARMPERAVPLALDASRSLAARHAHAEAAALLERVLTITDAPTALTLLEPLVDLYRISGDYRRAIVHAGALAEAAPESTEASRRFGHLLTLAGRLDEAAAELARARALAIAERRLEPESRAEALLAELAYQRARYDEALAWARSCLETAIELEDLPIQLHARNTLGKLALARQDAASAAELFEENRALASEEGLWHEHAQALTNLGIAMLRMRDFAGAERAFEQGVKVAQAASDTRDLAIATENLAVLAHLRREYDTALLRYREAMALLNGLGNRAMLSRVANNLGELHLSLGERVRARSLCEFAAQLGGAELPASIVGEGLLLRGRVERSDGNSGAARAALETALGIFEGLGEARILDASIELLHAELMDGDVSAARSLMASLPETQSPRREADLALIAVDIARLAGEPTGL